MPTEATETDGSTTGAEGAPAEPADLAGLQAALKAERKRRQDAETAHTTLKGQQDAAAQEAAKKRGEFEALYNDAAPKLTAAEKRIAEFEAKETARTEATKTRNTARIAALPEDFRDLVPDGLDPDATTAHIEKLEARAHKADPKFAKGGGLAGAPKGEPGLPAECIAEAKANAKDPQWWFTNVWNSPQAVKRRALSKT